MKYNPIRTVLAVAVAVALVVMAGPEMLGPEPRNGSEWSIFTAASEGSVGGFTSLALDSRDMPHISHHDFSLGNLKYTKWTGSAWNTETVDSGYAGAYGTSMALDSNDNPHISYSTMVSFDLKYASWTGSAWNTETVDSVGKVGYWVSMALDGNDNPHISYHDETNEDPKYASWTGSAWTFKSVDQTSDSGYDTSLALDSFGYPHISYVDYSPSFDLKYARWTGSAWNIETVDSVGQVGFRNSLALDANGNPHISYVDVTNEDLKYARWTGSAWSIEIVDSAVGSNWPPTSLALDSGGNPHISYCDTTHKDLKYARWTGSAWSLETVDSVGAVGSHSSLALDSSDRPHISYFDADNVDLKYATKGKIEQPPFADAGGPYASDEGSLVVLDASNSFDPNGDVLQYRWDFDFDGTWDTSWSILPYQVHTWYDDYNGYVTVQVTDGSNFVSASASVNIDNVAPAVSLGPDIAVSEGDTVTFGASVFDPGSDTLTYEWDFGDGAKSEKEHPQHTYSEEGRYTVTLKVKDGVDNSIKYANSVAIDSNDNPHISYFDSTEGALKYAKWTGGAWSIGTVATTDMFVPSHSMVLDSNDNPHICYFDTHDRYFRYAKLTGGTWSVQDVTYSGSASSSCSLALDSSDNPHIGFLFKEYGESYVVYGRWTGTTWDYGLVEEVHSPSDIASLALDSNGNPHMSYSEGDDIRYARKTGSSWSVETVDSGEAGLYVSIALDENDNPHIGYHWYPSSLKYAKWTGSSWDTEIVDSDGIYDCPNPLSLDSNGNPHLAYRGEGLRYARWTGSSWNVENVDLEYPWHISLALDSNDNPHIGVTDWHYDLRFAKLTGSAWSIDTVDGAPGVGSDTLEISVGNVAPIVSLGPDISVYEGDTVTFGASVFDPGGDALTYEWNFGDDTFSTELNPQHTYADDGTYTVTLKVTDDDDDFVGFDSSISLDSNDVPHISYWEHTDSNLKYAKWTGSEWATEIVDYDYSGQYSSIAIDKNDRPHIAYRGYSSTKYAKWTGSDWEITMVDSYGSGHNSLALDSNDRPHISYFDGIEGDLRYARWTGTAWTIETVDSAGNVGRYTSLAIDSSDNPHISYQDYDNTALKYAKWTGSAWNVETVSDESYVAFTSLALDSNENPHIGYWGGGYKGLRYAVWTGTAWNIETVELGRDVGRYASLALDSSDNPHLGYVDRDNDALRYAKLTGSDWEISTVDSHCWGHTSITLDSKDRPHISYMDYENGALKYTNWDGMLWSIETVDSAGVGSDSIVVTVLNVAPSVFLGPDLTVDEGEYVTLSATAFDPGSKDHLAYEWDLDEDGLFDDGIGQSVGWSWDDDGVYSASVRVTDDDGGAGTDTIYVVVNNVPPMAIATVDQNPVDEGSPATFTGDQTDPGSDVYEYYWEFGDGGTSTEQSPTYEYLDDGVYVVSFTVTDDDYESDTTWIIMHVNDLGPTADAGPDRSVTIIESVTFDGSSSSSYPDSIVSYEWDFGDGSTDTGEVVTHIFDVIGTYTVTLEVTDDDGSTDTDTSSVIVLAPGVELVPGDITFSPSSPTDVGISVAISSEVTNHGNTDAASATVRFYDGDPDKNDDGKPDTSAVQIGSDIVFSSIASGETVSVSATWTSTIGYHDIYVWADPDNFIPEYDDTNNQASDGIVVGPDLVTDDLACSPASPTAVGDSVTVSVDVTNNGGTTVTDVLVRFYEEYPDQNDDGFEDSSAVQIDDRTVDRLGPGETETVWVSWSPSEVGVYDLSAWVDPAVPSGGGWGAILEAVETNNLATDAMNVGPDLSIVFTDISFSDNPVSEGTEVIITAVIHNDGGQDASSVFVNFYHDQMKKKNLIDTVAISSITAGATHTVKVTWTATGVGYHEIWVVIDPKDNIKEYDETNNMAYNVLSVC